MIAGVVVVDASIVVEYLARLPRAAAARRVFDAVADGTAEAWSPDLVYCEVLSALGKLLRARTIDAPTADRACKWLAQLPITTPGMRDLVADVWALRRNITPYDGAYVALAGRLHAVLITGDERLGRSAQRIVRTITLAELGT